MDQKPTFYTWRRKSLIVRLLVPVNLISFVLLICMAATMVLKVRSSVESSLYSKVHGMLVFLDNAGQAYVKNYDISALENFTKIVSSDKDFNYAVFFDKENRPITGNSKVIEAAGVIKLERKMVDPDGNELGRVVIGYNTHRVENAFHQVVILASIFVILVQCLLSAAIFVVSRGIIKPLHHSLDKLSRTTNVLSGTSTEVSKFSEYLSSGVNQQAEVVQETTAAMSEMSTMLSQASNYAKDSEMVMTSVKQKANNGMNVMNQMVDAMSSVQQANEQLKQMVEIIREIASKTNVINDIVFKTQLLSFNASIEAARAGQHGRGFAVVAEEVGNLAKTSGNAAQQIAMLLQDSERQVNEIVNNTFERVGLGKMVTEQALKNFKDIAADINLMSNHISNITSAAREQELGVAQTTQAMSELSNATEINNSVAHRASETVKTLESEVITLHSIARAIECSITGDTVGPTREVPPSGDTDSRGLISGPWRQTAGMSQNEASNAESYKSTHAALSTEELGHRIVEMAKRAKESALVASIHKEQSGQNQVDSGVSEANEVTRKKNAG